MLIFRVWTAVKRKYFQDYKAREDVLLELQLNSLIFIDILTKFYLQHYTASPELKKKKKGL